MVDCGGLVLIRVPQENFNLESRTTLIKRNLSYRNIWFGGGLLSSVILLINGVETIQVAPKPLYREWWRNSPDYNIWTGSAEDGLCKSSSSKENRWTVTRSVGSNPTLSALSVSSW